MFVRIKKSSSRKTAVQLVEGYRDPGTGRVKQRVVRHIGYGGTKEEVEHLKELGEHIKAELSDIIQPGLFPPNMMAELAIGSKKNKASQSKDYKVDDMRKLRTQSRIMTGIHEVYGQQFDKLGFNKILSHPSRKAHSQHILREMVLARIANPDSKRGSVRFLSEQCGIRLNLDSVYKAMDYLDDQAIERIQNQTRLSTERLFPEKLDVLFYDATTLYFESFTEDELRSKGFSKDHKSQEVQILLSIFVTRHGLPVGYDIFPGSTYEGHTLLQALDGLKERFSINRVVFVADSGMLQKENLRLLSSAGYQYIVGARLKTMKVALKESILSEQGYTFLYDEDQERVKGKVIELDDGEKLIVTHSTKRSRKDAHDRKVALKKIEKRLKRGRSVKSLLSNSLHKKYLSVQGSGHVDLHQEKIEQASRWDGLHGLITNIDDVDIRQVTDQYRGLWQVEDTFRVAKHDLKIRPIYHWTERRIRAHIAICFMALVCVRHIEYRLMLANHKMSPKRIQRALLTVGVTTLQHIEDKRVFAVPFNPSDDARAIYKINDLNLSMTPYLYSE